MQRGVINRRESIIYIYIYISNTEPRPIERPSPRAVLADMSVYQCSVPYIVRRFAVNVFEKQNHILFFVLLYTI